MKSALNYAAHGIQFIFFSNSETARTMKCPREDIVDYSSIMSISDYSKAIKSP